MAGFLIGKCEMEFWTVEAGVGGEMKDSGTGGVTGCRSPVAGHGGFYAGRRQRAVNYDQALSDCTLGGGGRSEGEGDRKGPIVFRRRCTCDQITGFSNNTALSLSLSPERVRHSRSPHFISRAAPRRTLQKPHPGRPCALPRTPVPASCSRGYLGAARARVRELYIPADTRARGTRRGRWLLAPYGVLLERIRRGCRHAPPAQRSQLMTYYSSLGFERASTPGP
ncbi:hypothetical protein BC628DRAFT_705317 [Trametes gibbosa]|nr:hypothetical protein BC628DRAFT_705317 [Trametes gibbosa]